jgi:PPE-repeat protein
VVATAIVMAGFASARSVTAQSGAPESQPISTQAPAMAPPLAAGPPADLDLLVTAQVTGWIEPCG